MINNPNECEHCWNFLSSIHTYYHTINEEICCHCGTKKKEIIEIRPKSYSYPYKDKKNHGPFEPKTTRTY